MLKYAFVTNAGGRKYNEDCLKISSVSNRHCFVVCDGLGGHEYGDVAAGIAAETFIDELYYCEDMSGYLLKTFMKAQKRIEACQKESKTKKDMRTTVVSMVTDETYLYVGHVGDSRFYGFREDGSCVRTLDHSIPQLLVQSHMIAEHEIRNHPKRNMLLKVMGDKWDEPLCELSKPMQLNEFSALLLCSDGFWELITETEMTETLFSSTSPQEWLDKMLKIVVSNGNAEKMDNYSAIAVFVRKNGVGHR